MQGDALLCDDCSASCGLGGATAPGISGWWTKRPGLGCTHGQIIAEMVPVHFLSTLLSRSRPAPGQPAQASSVPSGQIPGKGYFSKLKASSAFGLAFCLSVAAASCMAAGNDNRSNSSSTTIQPGSQVPTPGTGDGSVKVYGS
jgi:hypothetical protein